jgi:hypothetical protein
MTRLPPIARGPAAFGLACGTACLLAVAGCSAEGTSGDAAAPPPLERPTRLERPAQLARATCPSGVPNCRTATGRILYVERVDPDGDGDAHFVLLSREAVTAPGISVIDVARSLRPSPLPGPGDRLSASGPVHRGSYGQRQIEAVELNVAPAG